MTGTFNGSLSPESHNYFFIKLKSVVLSYTDRLSYMLPQATTTDEVDLLNLFVKYLPTDVTDQQLFTLFRPFGEIVSSKVMV